MKVTDFSQSYYQSLQANGGTATKSNLHRQAPTGTAAGTNTRGTTGATQTANATTTTPSPANQPASQTNVQNYTTLLQGIGLVNSFELLQTLQNSLANSFSSLLQPGSNTTQPAGDSGLYQTLTDNSALNAISSFFEANANQGGTAAQSNSATTGSQQTGGTNSALDSVVNEIELSSLYNQWGGIYSGIGGLLGLFSATG